MPFYYGGYGGWGYGPRFYGAGLYGAALVGATYAAAAAPIVVQQPRVIVQRNIVQAPAQAPVPAGMQRVNITVPAGVQPGQNFTVNFQGNSFTVACPAGAFPGKQILIDVPKVTQQVPQAVPQQRNYPAPAPQAQYSQANTAYPQASYPPATVKATPKPTTQRPIVVVKIPQGVRSGQEFDITHNGRKYTIPCPAGVSAGMEIEVEL
mmetsp:Transcript_46363/g.68436  ORF Transcript_46363/g.68436 Transcript_46363/m.68436 type:complete len:207 (+) Transcript_46363:88-708(+)|eukprot:CAMPEP_0195517602 /NCGR_PEP_ID=MMETSP0794_2-20130614/11035_1 /TAXON_ID=515487 /ORGANISM="Stephanopyxis turris, Strain CCMP 815" /LENGTH=206 /DNA_ID=CAMNT_0040646425 /DNA_START=76 /DNA_END=696 /DNA_ORIENTATION=-